VHRFDATDRPLPVELGSASTHALGLAAAIELARELGRLPRRLVVYGIEGERFELGEGLTPAVGDAVERLVAELRRDLADADADRRERSSLIATPPAPRKQTRGG
jgi:hydrogenase maturation protease